MYAAGLIVAAHALLEAPGKKVFLVDPQAAVELSIYLAILVVLLAVRIPSVRSALVNLKYRSGRARQSA